MKQEWLNGRVIVITGCAKGMLASVAMALAQRGATIIGQYYQSVRQAKALEQKLKQRTPRSIMLRANLRKEKEIKRLFRLIEQKKLSVDILINGVGNFIYTPIDRVTGEEFDDVMETNLRSTFLCSAAVIPGMKRRRRGTIINIGCVGADRMTTREFTTPYYIAKTGVLMLTRITASALASHGIRVNAISPGVLETSVVKPSVPMRRYANANDLLNAILFLSNPESEYISGANVEVAGAWIP